MVWHLGLFGLTLHGTLSLGFYFRYRPEHNFSKSPGLYPFYPIGQCLQPLGQTSLHKQEPLSLFDSSVALEANLPGPFNACSLSFGVVAVGFNLCYSENPKVKTPSVVHQDIQITFPRFGNRNFWWEKIRKNKLLLNG